MKLQDGALVQWQESNAWQTGCVMTDWSSDVFTSLHGAESFGAAIAHGHGVLVRHSFTNELKFVDASRLTIRPNEHPE